MRALELYRAAANVRTPVLANAQVRLYIPALSSNLLLRLSAVLRILL